MFLCIFPLNIYLNFTALWFFKNLFKFKSYWNFRLSFNTLIWFYIYWHSYISVCLLAIVFSVYFTMSFFKVVFFDIVTLCWTQEYFLFPLKVQSFFLIYMFFLVYLFIFLLLMVTRVQKVIFYYKKNNSVNAMILSWIEQENKDRTHSEWKTYALLGRLELSSAGSYYQERKTITMLRATIYLAT